MKLHQGLGGALISTAMLCTGIPAHGEILKFANVGSKNLTFRWWPKLPPFPGWHQDEGASHNYGVNALAPDGQIFANAETVLYAKADYKPRMPETRTVVQLRENDRRDTLKAEPGVTVASLPDIVDADGKSFSVQTFTPGQGGGNWEAVAYGEEGDFFLTFSISSRAQAGYRRDLDAFRTLIGRYAEKLP